MRKLMITGIVLIAGAFVLGCGAAENGEETTLEAHEQGGPEEVTFTTSDGWEIHGSYYSCQAKGLPAVICVHMLRHDRTTYESLAPMLVGSGLDVLTIDSRGHGESVMHNGEKEKHASFDDTAYNSSVEDIAAAKEFLDEKGADTSRLGIIGASIGANYALIYGAGDADVKGVVLLSPGLDYHGVETEPAMKEYAGRPALVAASSEDRYSAESCETLADLGGDAAELKIFDGAGHGTDMLDAEPDFEAEVAGWFAARLSP
jgi:alpha-beta hydrolase superfamily lysophospholipase